MNVKVLSSIECQILPFLCLNYIVLIKTSFEGFCSVPKVVTYLGSAKAYLDLETQNLTQFHLYAKNSTS